jgi:hypothetical protein
MGKNTKTVLKLWRVIDNKTPGGVFSGTPIKLLISILGFVFTEIFALSNISRKVLFMGNLLS